MTKTYAYANHAVHRTVDGVLQVVPASSKGKVSVFEADKDEFASLSKLGAVRAATKEELAQAKADVARENGEAVEDDPAPLAQVVAPPASGAAHDPSSAPRGKATS